MENNKRGFNFLKATLGNIFMLFYRPKKENIEYIPQDGPIIIAGNHIHLFDQNLPIMCTKRMVHYLAKIEHLTGKFSFLFKMAGCIGVNRNIHDKDAKTKSIEVLNKGQALGIFPEGTRNSAACKKEYLDKIYEYYKSDMSKRKLKKILKRNVVRMTQIDFLEVLLKNKKITTNEYKEALLEPNELLIKLYNKKIISKKEYVDSFLLPIKFGAVSSAQKTNATIVPYVITGKYKFKNNNLKVTFLKPFKVKLTDDLEKVNEKLRKLMSEAIFENIIELKKAA